MPQSAETRARQHLLFQGFTLYTMEAADALRQVGSKTLDNPEHAWAVELPDNFVQCHVAGQKVIVPLEPAIVRDVRMRLEAAIITGSAPAAEKLEAFPDELIRREAKRRGLLKKPEDKPEGF